MLTVAQLSKAYAGRVLFADASLQINVGDRVGLIGANGAGKSTLFSLILGDISPDAGTVSLQRGAAVGFLPQENAPCGDETVLELAMAISSSFVEILRALRESPDDSDQHHEAFARFAEVDGYALEAKAKRILAGLAFREDDFKRRAQTMSGGWIMRAHLARLLVMEPDLLMLDEPTNHLDLESLTALNNGLIAFPEVLLLASRDHELVSTVANRIVEITPDGVIDRVMGFEEYLEAG
jgi:ATP-binding cassette subfamily F protein 3